MEIARTSTKSYSFKFKRLPLLRCSFTQSTNRQIDIRQNEDNGSQLLSKRHRKGKKWLSRTLKNEANGKFTTIAHLLIFFESHWFKLIRSRDNINALPSFFQLITKQAVLVLFLSYKLFICLLSIQTFRLNRQIGEL